MELLPWDDNATDQHRCWVKFLNLLPWHEDSWSFSIYLPTCLPQRLLDSVPNFLPIHLPHI
ncbi:MAG: hypothetical protein ACO2PL_17965 [Armatimonadota bacterium]